MDWSLQNYAPFTQSWLIKISIILKPSIENFHNSVNVLFFLLDLENNVCVNSGPHRIQQGKSSHFKTLSPRNSVAKPLWTNCLLL